MCQPVLLLGRILRGQLSTRAYTGKVALADSKKCWCPDGFKFLCDKREKFLVTFALDCCVHEALHWEVGKDGFNSDTVQDTMLVVVERSFGQPQPTHPFE